MLPWLLGGSQICYCYTNRTWKWAQLLHHTHKVISSSSNLCVSRPLPRKSSQATGVLEDTHLALVRIYLSYRSEKLLGYNGVEPSFTISSEAQHHTFTRSTGTVRPNSFTTCWSAGGPGETRTHDCSDISRKLLTNWATGLQENFLSFLHYYYNRNISFCQTIDIVPTAIYSSATPGD